MNAERLVAMQRELRSSLLDHSGIAWPAARDLAAHLLLHLDDPGFAWQLAVGWLRDALDADRVDAGFGSPHDGVYQPQAEARRADCQIPSLLGSVIDATDAGVQGIWTADGVVALRDIEHERWFGARLRQELLASGARDMLATAIWYRDMPVGLACADWTAKGAHAVDERRTRLQEVASSVLGPILAAARCLAIEGSAPMQVELAGPPMETNAQSPAILGGLTPAECKVAQLAAAGLSYKEIARELDRAFSTVDHQLRSVRAKLGVSSTGQLMRLISGLQRDGKSCDWRNRSPMLPPALASRAGAASSQAGEGTPPLVSLPAPSRR